MWHARVIGGAAVLLLGIATILLAGQLPYHATSYGPGPGFLPTWIGYVLAVCGIIVTIQELRAPNKGETFFQPRTRMALKVLLVIAGAFLLIPWLGFSVGFGLFIGVTMRLMGKHGWITCSMAAILTMVGIHYLFGQWLDIPLPTGLVGW